MTFLSPDFARWLTRDGRVAVTYWADSSAQQGAADELAHALASLASFTGASETGRVALPVVRRWLLKALDALETHGLLSAPLTHVVDLSGVYLPGQGTPLAVLLSDAAAPPSPTVRVLRCDGAEPERPERMGDGRVWRAIVEAWDTPGSTPWTATADVERRAPAVAAYLRAGEHAEAMDRRPTAGGLAPPPRDPVTLALRMTDVAERAAANARERAEGLRLFLATLSAEQRAEVDRKRAEAGR